MSIIKNVYDIEDGHITIKALSSLTDNNETYNIQKYVHLENCGYQTDKYSNSAFYFMMRCELPENASGYLMGVKGGADSVHTFYIKIENKVITWAVGADTFTHVWEPGVHDIGWVDGKPVYDNALVNSTAVAHSGIHVSKMAICGVNDSGTYSYINSINLYRVNITVYGVTAPTAQSRSYLEAFYPCPTVLRNALKYPEQRLYTQHNTDATYDFSASDETVTYGVQLDDLRYITGSGYTDLFALIAEDDEARADEEADGPSIVSKTGETHKFAFYLGSANEHIPIPDTYAVSKQGSTSYDKGELITGRRPKWSIWNDAIKFGKHGVEVSGNKVKMKFNLYKGNDATTHKPDLKYFDGYDTGKNYPPMFSLDGEILMEYHNGVAARMDANALLIGNNHSDERAVFAYSSTSGGLGRIILGNLPLWAYSNAEQKESAGLSLLWCCGGGLVLKVENDGGGWTDFATILAFSEQYSEGNVIGLSSDTAPELMKALKEDGIEGSSFFREKATAQLRDQLSQTGQRIIRAVLALVNGVTNNPTDNQIIDVTDLVKARESIVRGLFDSRIGIHDTNPSHEDDRMMVGESGGIAKSGDDEYVIEIPGSSYSMEYPSHYSLEIGPSTGRYGYGIGIPIALRNGDNYATLGNMWLAYISVVSEVKNYDTASFSETDIINSSGKTYSFDIPQPLKHSDARIVIDNIDRTDIITESTAGDTTTYQLTIPHEYNVTENVRMYINILTYGASQTRNAMLEITAAQTMQSTLTVTLTKSSNKTTVTISWDNEHVMKAACNIVLSRAITGRYYGFTKLINPRNTTNTNNYYYKPLSYSPNTWESLKVQPSSNTVSDDTSLDGGKTAAALFLWKHLKGLGDGATSEDRPNDDLTAHVRVFPVSDAPHAWDIYGERNFEAVGENPYKSISSTNDRVVYHNHNRLLTDEYCVDAWMTLWNSAFTTQKTASTALDGRTIRIYAEAYDEPRNARVRTLIYESLISNGGGTTDNNGYHCVITTNQTYTEWAQMPNVNSVIRGYDLGGFFHIRVTNNNGNPTPGTMYLVDIS